MAVENRARTRSKASLLTRVVLGSVLLASLGWMLLFSWAVWLWSSDSLTRASNAVAELGRQQSFVIQEFSDASLVRVIRERMTRNLSQLTQPLLKHVGRIEDTLEQYIGTQGIGWTERANGAIDDAFREWCADRVRTVKNAFALLQATGTVLCIKLIILMAAIPLFGLAIIAGLVDGLNQRAIRTASLGRESTYVFHKSIPLVKKTMLVVLGLWLAVPVALHPSIIFVSLAVLLSLVVSMTASRFKKYL